jgi:ketosteroid isomerase-like protein
MKIIWLIPVLLIMVAGCAEKEARLDNELKDEIRKVVLEGEAWWNEGNIKGYMGTYWKSPDLRFASGGKVTFGWQKTLDGYLKRYPDRAAMGRLVFSDLDITILSHESALVFGAWKLEREHDQPHGMFTLLLRRFDEGWRIVHDHTSSAAMVKD